MESSDEEEEIDQKKQNFSHLHQQSEEQEQNPIDISGPVDVHESNKANDENDINRVDSEDDDISRHWTLDQEENEENTNTKQMTSSTPTTSPQKRLSVFLRFKKQI